MCWLMNNDGAVKRTPHPGANPGFANATAFHFLSHLSSHLLIWVRHIKIQLLSCLHHPQPPQPSSYYPHGVDHHLPLRPQKPIYQPNHRCNCFNHPNILIKPTIKILWHVVINRQLHEVAAWVKSVEEHHGLFFSAIPIWSKRFWANDNSKGTVLWTRSTSTWLDGFNGNL